MNGSFGIHIAKGLSIFQKEVPNMIYIVTAMYVEAKPIIKYYNLKREMDEKYFQVFLNGEIILVISGIGKIASATATSHILTKFQPSDDDFIINIGICGAKENAKIGDLFIINKIVDKNTNKDYYTDILIKHNLKESSIETIDKPLYRNDDLKENLCDMESIGFYLSATKYLEQHQIFILKIVSDRVGVDIVDKNIVKNIVMNNIHSINQFIENVKCSNHEKDVLNEQERAIIKGISERMNLTKSQRGILYKYCLHYKVRTGKEILFLADIPLNDVNNKNERTKYFDEILTYLR